MSNLCDKLAKKVDEDQTSCPYALVSLGWCDHRRGVRKTGKYEHRGHPKLRSERQTFASG